MWIIRVDLLECLIVRELVLSGSLRLVFGFEVIMRCLVVVMVVGLLDGWEGDGFVVGVVVGVGVGVFVVVFVGSLCMWMLNRLVCSE